MNRPRKRQRRASDLANRCSFLTASQRSKILFTHIPCSRARGGADGDELGKQQYIPLPAAAAGMQSGGGAGAGEGAGAGAGAGSGARVSHRYCGAIIAYKGNAYGAAGST